MTREELRQFYIRTCRDAGWGMDHVKAALFAGRVLGVSPLEFWIAFGDLGLMERIARGDHPVCHK